MTSLFQDSPQSGQATPHNPWVHPRHQLHFVGVGGIGMSGIAEVFLNQGYRVSGSDIAPSESTRRLEKLGVRIFIGHEAANVTGADVVVISSAIRPSNPEVVEARRLRVPVIPRAEMLGELMRGKLGVAVAGTHGKTTTTSLISTVLTEAGEDPTLVIGGKVDSLGGNAKLGQGRLVVAEADESDGSFTHLPATVAVVTNIDNDHLDHYGSLAEIEAAFVDFVGKLPFYGVAVVCGDDAGVRRCLGRFTKPFVTYGRSSENDFFATGFRTLGMGTAFTVHERAGVDGGSRILGELEVPVPGDHNVLNALAAAVVCLRLGVPFEKIRSGLASFRGVKRRFDIRYRDDAQGLVVVDDYGHHPTEISATLGAARQFWPKPGRILVVFQPHRYSRTLHCRDGFRSAFRIADLVCLTEIYAAGESPIEGVSSEALLQDLKEVALEGQRFELTPTLEDAEERLVSLAQPGDLILCMGAGSITRLPERLASRLQSRDRMKQDSDRG
jgi:UDP-N-acetylmuramate--alanine ligase